MFRSYVPKVEANKADAILNSPGIKMGHFASMFARKGAYFCPCFGPASCRSTGNRGQPEIPRI
jgi:hypothetical protein